MNKTLLLSFGIVGMSMSAHAVLIDNFTDGAYNSGYISSGFASGWVNATVPGTIRYTKLTVDSSTLGDDARLRVVTGSGVMTVSNGVGVDGSTDLGYGFAANSTVPMSNALNFNMTSAPIVRVRFLSNDLPNAASVTLYKGNNTTEVRSLSIPALSGATNYDFDFSSVAATLGDVDAMKFSFNTSSDGDFALQNISTVPEPASMAVMGLGIAAMLRKRRASK
jgi:hypothetical protein